MRQLKYLNVILTINAALLALLVWTQLAGHNPLAQSAHAQRATDSGMTTAAEQRKQMIDALRDIRQATTESNQLLQRSTIRVHVANAAELRADQH